MNKDKHSIGIIYEYDEVLDELIKGFNGTDIGFWYYDIINKRIIHRDHSIKVHGFSNEVENVPESLIECGYVHPDSAADFLDMYEKLAGGEERVEGDFWIRPLGTDDFWCERITYTVISYSNGKPALAMGVSKDVTYEKTLSNKVYSDDVVNFSIKEDNISLEDFLCALNENYSFANNVIRQAVMNNEFEIYLQPKVDLKNRCIYGAEALVRWNHPKFGIISPGFFIEILEAENLIDIIDKFSICEVLKFQKHQIELGYSVVPISCNLSAITLSSEGVAEYIHSSLKAMDLSEEMLIIEITETAFVDNNEIIMNNINKLKEFGFKISMDDFGTGASSLAQLANMPVDEIKLDIKMVRNAVSSSRGNAILLAVIQLAKALKLDIIAEGMENFEQVNYIEKTGCRYCQCYYFSKPLKIKDFKRYIASGNLKNSCAI